MSETTTTKVRCRQDALCARKHSECDCCGRMVHETRSHGDEGPSACYLCSSHQRPGSSWDRYIDKLWKAARDRSLAKESLDTDKVGV